MYFAKQNQFPDVDPVALESKGRALAALIATVKETEGVVQSKEAEARDLQVYGRRERRGVNTACYAHEEWGVGVTLFH